MQKDSVRFAAPSYIGCRVSGVPGQVVLIRPSPQLISTAQTVGLRLTFVQPMPKVRGSAAKQMADAALPDTGQGTQAPQPQGSEQKEEVPEEEKDAPERKKENDGEPKDDDGGEGLDAPPLSEPKPTQGSGDDTGLKDEKDEAVRDEA